MLFAAEEAKNSSKTNQVLSKKSAKSGIGKAAASAFAYAIFALRLPVWFYKKVVIKNISTEFVESQLKHVCLIWGVGTKSEIAKATTCDFEYEIFALRLLVCFYKKLPGKKYFTIFSNVCWTWGLAMLQHLSLLM